MDFELRSRKDLRSSSVPKQRRRKELNKYYSYRAVHPSWVGQDYYTLQLVSSTVHTACIVPHRLQHKTSDFHVTHVTEKEEPALLEKLRADSGWFTFHPWYLAPQVEVAIAQAKNANIDSYPIVLEEFKSGFTEPTDPHTIERVSIEPPAAYPLTMPNNLHLKLRVKTWTKKDNYENSTHFWWGPDRRHSRGKRSCRERHLQKWHEKELGRGTRERAARLKWEVNGSCGILRDRYNSWGNTDYDDWMSDVDTTYWDWDDENWLGTGWWDDDGCVADEGWGYRDRWTERVDLVEVIYKVSEWRQLWCDYEGMAELEGVEEMEGDAVPVGSDVVVLEYLVDVDVDVDADLDRMSDLAEVLVQGEWDVVSETSSSSGSFVRVES